MCVCVCVYLKRNNAAKLELSVAETVIYVEVRREECDILHFKPEKLLKCPVWLEMCVCVCT